MRRFTTYGPAFVVLATTVATLFAAPAAVRHIGFANSETQIRLARLALDQDDILERINAATRNIATAVEPSVVHIAIDASGGTPLRMAQGSGWVYDDSGHVVTNAHVIRGGSRIVVQFHDGRTSPADLVGIDSSTDIAVLKARTSEGIFPAERATGQEMHQGDRVYAFGSPFGFKFSMSEGIVSGLGRDPRAVINTPGGGYTNFIQTDAAVNPGNSGGPLVDIKGRVVGMNVAIATAGNTREGGGQNSGISFAIPLETIEAVVSQLITAGAVARGYLGIHMPVSPGRSNDAERAEDENRRRMELAGYRGRGVIVTDVVSHGPAARAGLRPGDIITKLNGKLINSITVLRSAITVNRPGDRITIEVWRDGRLVELAVVLADLAQSNGGLRETEMAILDFGLEGRAIRGGFQVTDVMRGSPADEAGFRAGQVIVQLEGEEVVGKEHLLADLASRGFLHGRPLTATVREPDGRVREVRMRYQP